MKLQKFILCMNKVWHGNDQKCQNLDRRHWDIMNYAQDYIGIRNVFHWVAVHATVVSVEHKHLTAIHVISVIVYSKMPVPWNTAQIILEKLEAMVNWVN